MTGSGENMSINANVPGFSQLRDRLISKVMLEMGVTNIPPNERKKVIEERRSIVSIEDTAELQLRQEHISDSRQSLPAWRAMEQ